MRIFLLLLTICLLQTQPAHALRCKSPSLKELYERSELVVAGLITNISDGVLEGGRIKTRLFTMHVLKTWKGEGAASIKLLAKYDDYAPSLLFNKNYVVFLEKKDNEGRYPIYYCNPQEEIGEENGYLITLLLDKMATGQPHYFMGYQERTPENSFVGHGLGLTDEEMLKKSHEHEDELDAMRLKETKDKLDAIRQKNK